MAPWLLGYCRGKSTADIACVHVYVCSTCTSAYQYVLVCGVEGRRGVCELGEGGKVCVW